MAEFLVAYFESDSIQHLITNFMGFLTGTNVTKIFVSLFLVSFALYVVRRVFWG